MLSRPAGAVLDLGRHVERADGVARLLSLHLSLVDAVDPAHRDALVGDLLALAGVDAPAEQGERRSLLDRLGYDAECPSSVLGTWARARTSAHAAREALPEQVREVLEATPAAVPSTRWRGKDPEQFLAWVRERTAVVVGSADMACPRDEAWWFLRLGIALERATAAAVLILAAVVHEPLAGAATSASALLRAAGAPAAMRARRSTRDEATGAVLMDRAWPRSLVAALVAAEEALEGLRSEGVRPDALDAARQRLVRVRTSLEYRPVEATLADLPALVRQVRRSVGAVVGGLEDACLAPRAPTSWLVHAG